MRHVIGFISFASRQTGAPSWYTPPRRRTGLQIEISENLAVRVDEIQRPITGGGWKSQTEFGALEIKIVPFWTGEPIRDESPVFSHVFRPCTEYEVGFVWGYGGSTQVCTRGEDAEASLWYRILW